VFVIVNKLFISIPDSMFVTTSRSQAIACFTFRIGVLATYVRFAWEKAHNFMMMLVSDERLWMMFQGENLV
jgi:hypothetical protein